MRPNNQSQVIHVSTTFFPAAILPGADGPPSLIILTSDSVFFYTHTSVILSKSSNRFAGLVEVSTGSQSGGSDGSTPSNRSTVAGGSQTPVPRSPGGPKTIIVNETSTVMNVILHFIYGMSCERYAPCIDTLIQVHEALQKYALPPVMPNDQSDIPKALVRLAPTSPMRVYTLAASLNLEIVCVSASHFTLTTTLDTITEADALTMGPKYLKRLAFLHSSVSEALKNIVKAPPEVHGSCKRDGEVRRLWLQAVGCLLVQPAPHQTSSGHLISKLSEVKSSVECAECEELVHARITEVMQAWVAVKRTI